MKRILISTALVLSSLAATAPASAFEARTSCIYSRTMGTSSCRFVVNAPEKPIELTAQELYERETRAVKWEKFCQPQKTVDDLGVVRLVYAQRGCEFGRSE